MNSKILKISQVVAQTTLSKSSIYDFIKRGKFPPPVRLSERSVGWLACEVEGWLEQRAQLRGGAK